MVIVPNVREVTDETLVKSVFNILKDILYIDKQIVRFYIIINPTFAFFVDDSGFKSRLF